VNGEVYVNSLTPGLGFARFDDGSGTPPVLSPGVYVDGNVMATNFVDIGNLDARQVCLDSNGVAIMCPEPTETYSWYTSSWGSCTGATSGSCSGSYSGGGSCSGTPTGGSLYRPRCSDDGNYPNQDYFCAIDQGEWVNTGTSCPTVTHLSLPNPPGFNDVFPYNLGQSVCIPNPSARCDGVGQLSCESTPGCTWGGTFILCNGADQSSCESENPACTWNAGTSGTQTRTVECRDSGGTVVADGFCTDPEPTSSQSC
jgi:hypothetical protein